ncbi:MAG: glycosyltransferase family 2 protein [Bacteroidia bacterium]|nr:glycosyltransferase family 2 protein [Bacteroidia bacterium]
MSKEFQKGLVSVVVNTYNHVSFIESCVNGIINQSFKNIEIIITDDGSTDGSQELLREIEKKDPRIRVLYSEKNKGMSANLNKGLLECRGEYFILIAGDDQMLPGKIELQHAFMEANKSVAICWHDMEVFDSATDKILYNFNEKYSPPRNFDQHLFYTNWFFFKPVIKLIPSSLMSRTSYFTFHLWDERLKYTNEILHALLIYAEYPSLQLGFIPKILGRYRIHTNNVSTSAGMKKYGMEEMFMAYCIASIRYPSISLQCKSHLDYYLFMHLLYKWIPEENLKYFERFYMKQSGPIKYGYLKFCRLLIKWNILFVFFKPLRGLYKFLGNR